jgi:hypothetical protein
LSTFLWLLTIPKACRQRFADILVTRNRLATSGHSGLQHGVLAVRRACNLRS